jgi:DNA invertase Pin-like site-specific DNA recombinase
VLQKRKDVGMTEKKTGLIYIRLSQTRDESDENSVERQIANCVKVCEENGWKYELFIDAEGHKSGTTTKGRYGWQDLINRLDDPEVVAVIANDSSRLHRKAWQMGKFIEELHERKIQLVFASSASSPDLSTPMGQVQVQFRALFDQIYADDIRTKAIDSVNYRKSKGVSIGLPPFGTVRDNNGYLVPSPEGYWIMPDGTYHKETRDNRPEDAVTWRGFYEAAKRVLELYSQGNKGTTKIAEIMNAEGWIPYRRPKKNSETQKLPEFTPDDIRRIKDNWAEYGGYVSNDKKRAKEQRAKIDDFDSIVLIEARSVFPLDLLYRVRDVIKDRSIETVDNGVSPTNYSYPLSGVLRCANCHRHSIEQDDPSLVTNLGGVFGNLEKPTRYRHTSRKTCGCKNKSVLAHIPESEVARLLAQLDISEEAFARLEEAAIAEAKHHQNAEDEVDVEAEKREQIALCERKLRNLKILFADGEMEEREYRQRRSQIETEIQMWEAKASDVTQIYIEFAECAALLRNMSQMWSQASPEDKQGMTQNLFEWIAFDLDTHRITDLEFKSWIHRIITVQGELLYDDKGNKKPLEVLQGEYTAVPPTGIHAVRLSA